jgi:hypothetical protein
MDANRFDTITKLFAARRSRRQAMLQGGAGLAAGALAAAGLHRPAIAQEATPQASPIAAPEVARNTETLFLQAFQSGTIAPVEGQDGRYTVTLEQGLGQTIYFTDRPERVVGATPTAQFLGNIGFPVGDPPNAALVVEKEGGTTEIAVVELFEPTYDQETRTATYEVAVLKEWERELGVGLDETPGDLAAFGPEFGAAHLFIDDCADGTVTCYNETRSAEDPSFTLNAGFCYVNGCCQPCTDGSDPHSYWAARCQATEPTFCINCEGGCEDDGINHCTISGWDSWLIPCAS